MTSVVVTRSEILTALSQNGIESGCTLLVHSSLSSFGRVEGGAETVIHALREAVGKSGTIIAPTLTGNKLLSAANPPVFDPENTPCWTGRIPETLRMMPGSLRSLHPTHSVAAIGANAEWYTRDHQWSLTPCDDLSPYGKLVADEKGYILLLGVDHESSTVFHAVEEAVGVDYHMQPGLVKATVLINGHTTYRHYMLHQYGTPRNFNVMDEVFSERGIQRIFRIGTSTVRLVKAAEMFALTRKCLTADKGILTER